MGSVASAIRIIATVQSKTSSRARRYLIKSVGSFLINAKYITTSPITDIGLRLYNYFNFEHIADEIHGETIYPIYELFVEKEKIVNKIEKF